VCFESTSWKRFSPEVGRIRPADVGVSSRLLAAFLSWMQERKAPVFVVATCNNVSALPPELIRKGRFDDCSLSTCRTRRSESRSSPLELARGNRRPAELDLDRVAATARGYSGAEIQAAVQDSALRLVFQQATAGNRFADGCVRDDRTAFGDPGWGGSRNLEIGHERVRFRLRLQMPKAKVRRSAFRLVPASTIDSHPTPGVPLSQWLLLAPRERAFRLVPPAERRILLSLRPVRVCLCRRDAI
jgi:SpoVK/Ycf46/Vps4 family AAA+-type ATPase